jgi:copper chaperone
METVSINVQGMSCGGCVAGVTRALKTLPGVADVSVTLDPAQATVEFDPARTSVPALRAAIENAGYDVAA